MGPGKIALLEQIARDGSLSQAARELKMSYRRACYRRAWLLLESLNGCFVEPVALTAKGGRGGGGATLTPFGRELIRAYRKLDAEIQVRALRHLRPFLTRTRSRASARAAARARRGRAPVVHLKDR